MPALRTIRMHLTGPFEGVTKLFGRYQFINGMCDFTGNDEQCGNVMRYFTQSYQVKITDPTVAEIEENEVEVPELPEAIRVDDSAVISDEDLEAQEAAAQEEIDHPEPEQPNKRQQDIIAAVNGVEKTDWVDLTAKTPRPKVEDVRVLMEDPTVNKKEIIEVIQKWLS